MRETVRIGLAGAAIALLPTVAQADEFKCGKDYITFPTTGNKKDGPMRIITVQRRLIVSVVSVPRLGEAVVIGRDGVPDTGSSRITPDIYRLLVQCLNPGASTKLASRFTLGPIVAYDPFKDEDDE